MDQVYLNGLELRVEQLNVQRDRAGLGLLQLRHGEDLAGLVADPQVVAVISGACGECVTDQVEAVETAGVPLVTLAPGTGLADPPEERRHVFQLAPDPGQSADLIAEHISADGGTQVAVVTSNDRYGNDGAGELPAALDAFDMELVLAQTVDVGLDEAAAAAVAADITQWPPPPADPFTPPEPGGVDTVVVWAGHDEALRLVHALRGEGFDGLVILDSRAARRPFLDRSDAQVMTGVRMLAPPVLTADQVIAANPAAAARSQWTADYISAHFGNEAPAAYAADALGLVHTATEAAGGDDRQTVRDQIENLYAAGLAASLRFTPHSHNGLDVTSFVVVGFSGERWSLFLS